MKKNLNALMLLGIALTLGTGNVVQARDIRHETRNPEGSSFQSNRQNGLSYERRARTSKQEYASELWRDRRGESLAEYRQGNEARGFISDLRLVDDRREAYIRAYAEAEEIKRAVSERQSFPHRDHKPDKARDGSKDGHHPGHVRDARSRSDREP